MELLVVLSAGWVALGAVCFGLGAGLLRPEPGQVSEPVPAVAPESAEPPAVLPLDRLRLPGPRTAADARVATLR